VIVRAVSSLVLTDCAVATGASFTELTVILAVATFESVPLLALYVKESEPWKFAAGVYVKEPSAFSVKELAFAGPVTSTAVSPVCGGSVSLPSTPGAASFSVVSSFVEYESFAADGLQAPPTYVVAGLVFGGRPKSLFVPRKSLDCFTWIAHGYAPAVEGVVAVKCTTTLSPGKMPLDEVFPLRSSMVDPLRVAVQLLVVEAGMNVMLVAASDTELKLGSMATLAEPNDCPPGGFSFFSVRVKFVGEFATTQAGEMLDE
jgi:hypothetical protein